MDVIAGLEDDLAKLESAIDRLIAVMERVLPFTNGAPESLIVEAREALSAAKSTRE